MKTWYHFGILVLILLIIPSIVVGQAALRGSVKDSLSEEMLVGANVYLQGTALGASTDIEGKFRIAGVPAGSYMLRFSYIGYKAKVVPITVTDKEMVINIELMPDNILEQEVVITAQLRGQMAAINQQISSNTIVNVVSEEKIKQLPDANAAEAIGRLPGVSILRSGGEANKVILRGLSDKFTTITIDGVKIPPTDPDSRGVDLSTISQGSLAGIELFKALTPDKDADAIAGTVNLVTKKAPMDRSVQADIKGDYNKLMNSAKQYDLSLRYGERFFDGQLGLQVLGNLENRIRSNEQTTTAYQDRYDMFPATYFISNFRLQFIDEIRKRDGAVIMLDYDTPDSGSVRLSANYNRTERDFTTFQRNYPTLNAGSTPVYYEARDREQQITTVNSSVRGENYLFGLKFNWGASFAQSLTDNPFDYYIDFTETIGRRDASGHVSSGMDIPLNFTLRSNPKLIIPFAVNNFAVAGIDSGISTYEKNREIEKTVYLDGGGGYVLGNLFSGELKLGGKYKHITRFKEASRLYAPYYLGGFAWQPKNLSGTRFNSFYQQYLANNLIRLPSFLDFLDSAPVSRNLFDKYLINPIMNKDAVHEWYVLNQNGRAASIEYYVDKTAELDYYDVTESITAAYIMNTLRIGQDVTFIAGVRMEQETNEYLSRFVPGTGSLGGFPTPSGDVKDTSTTFSQTVWLPNFHLAIRPTDYLQVRLAAYRALSRPDYNARLIKLYALGTGTVNNLFVGNPNLKVAKAWNYEVNASVYSNTLGLVSLSAYLKDITDAHHFLNGAGIVGRRFLDSLGIVWSTALTKGGYQLTVPYNSSAPTKVWGFEFEHQANLSFLPWYFQHLVLSYNFSLVRSETHLVTTMIDTTWTIQQSEFGEIRTPSYTNRIVDRVQKLEQQPEFFGNVTLGYEIGDFSARLSVFHQGEFNSRFSPGGLTDGITGSYSRWDLTVKHSVTPNIALLVSVSNLFDIEENSYTTNRVYEWTRLNTNQKYGLTMDFGVRVTL
ncbi:MAG: TonB-dependent receptor [bacterium]